MNKLLELQQELLNGNVTMVSIVEHYLKNIREASTCNAFVHVFADEALSKAKEIDLNIKNKNPLGKLFGIVLSIKDNICIEGKEVSAASGILKGYQSPYSATVVERVIKEDAIIIGTTNCDEFGMGSTSTNSVYGPVKNGSDISLIAGGSSGGAAVSVQMDCCNAAMGSDTGGSIRQPASLCDVLGFKPSYGKVSRHGLLAYGSSFDQIGIISKCESTISEIFKVIKGIDEYDSTCIETQDEVFEKKEKLKIGYIDEMFPNENEFTSQIKELIFSWKEKHKVCKVNFDYMKYLVPCYYILTTAEASSNLSRYDGVRYGHRANDAKNIDELYKKSRTEGFGKEVKKRIMLGTFVLSEGYYDAYYTKAQKVRRLITEQFEGLFRENDIIAMPVTPSPAWDINYKAEDAIEVYMSDIYTVLANITGLPAISIPFKKNNKTINIQLIGKKGSDQSLLEITKQLIVST
jgi:aspartyl-tRNA(Asn)/glutamyl-tRNA(Gln) amidotransferase subunit A